MNDNSAMTTISPRIRIARPLSQTSIELASRPPDNGASHHSLLPPLRDDSADRPRDPKRRADRPGLRLLPAENGRAGRRSFCRGTRRDPEVLGPALREDAASWKFVNAAGHRGPPSPRDRTDKMGFGGEACTGGTEVTSESGWHRAFSGVPAAGQPSGERGGPESHPGRARR